VRKVKHSPGLVACVFLSFSPPFLTLRLGLEKGLESVYQLIKIQL
jgi:hypothetical protein